MLVVGVGENAVFKELVPTSDELVLCLGQIRRMKGREHEAEDGPFSPFHMFRRTWIWLATCFLERSMPALRR